jgi:uncharacterized protein (TIGR00369 family)
MAASTFFGIDSPFVAHCAIEGVDKGPEGVRARLVVGPELTNSMGGAHGGAIATLLDSAMVAAARFFLDPEGQRPVGTVDLSVSFIGKARGSLDCRARVVARRGSTLFAEALVQDEAGAIVARGVATLRAAADRDGSR